MINIFKKKGVETEKNDADNSALEQATNENEVETCKEEVNTDQPCKPKKGRKHKAFTPEIALEKQLSEQI